jgi:hypothetical protein
VHDRLEIDTDHEFLFLGGLDRTILRKRLDDSDGLFELSLGHGDSGMR